METSAPDLTGAMRTLGSTGGNELLQAVGVLCPASFGFLSAEEICYCGEKIACQTVGALYPVSPGAMWTLSFTGGN